jgi:hypothetical protein
MDAGIVRKPTARLGLVVWEGLCLVRQVSYVATFEADGNGADG